MLNLYSKEVLMMIKLNKSKRLEAAFGEIKSNIISNNNSICKKAMDSFVSDMTDFALKEYYKEFGIEDHEMLRSHKLITEMPFNKEINLSFLKNNESYKTYTIHKHKYEPLNYSIRNRELKEYIPLVHFDENITLPMICEDNLGWMTPVLFEEATMQEAVNKAHGHILVVGLGIGFYPFNCLQKEEVKKVTILEYNKQIIDLFKEHILPQFPRANDIEIIHGDAYEYVNNDYLKQFDYTFIDIWRNDSDGTVILSNLFKNIDFSEPLNVDFWIEDTILSHVQDSLFIYLLKLYEGNLKQHLTGKINESREVEDFITFDKVHRYFKDKNIFIHNRNDLLDILNDKSLLRDMLKSF